MRRIILGNGVGVLIFLVLLVSGCSTVKVGMQVTHPAEINMTPYKQVAIGEITGDMGQSTSDAIKNYLVEGGKFQVMERGRLSEIMKELTLSQSDLADSKKRVKLGKLLPASAMITGRADGQYNETRTSSQGTCKDMESGREAALKDAFSKVAGFLGSNVQSVFTEHSTELEQRISQQISSKSNASIRGAEAVDWYYEKVTRVDEKFRMEKYDVYVLMSFQKGEVDQELQRQQKEKSEKIATAYTLYNRGKDAEKRKTYIDAGRFFREALMILEALDEIVVMENSEIKNSAELTQLVKTQLHVVISSARQLAVSIHVKGLEEKGQAFQSSLVSSLSEQGFTVTRNNPAIDIRGEVSVSESSVVMNNRVFYAEGNVSAKRVSDGQVIAVVPVKAKGFHRNPDPAALNALTEGGLEAGKELANMLLEKENPAAQ